MVVEGMEVDEEEGIVKGASFPFINNNNKDINDNNKHNIYSH